MKNRKFSLRAMALAGAGMMIAPQAAAAQEAQAEAQNDGSAIGALNEIIVTGTKTQNAENVQDIPLAVTAFNSESLCLHADPSRWQTPDFVGCPHQ